MPDIEQTMEIREQILEAYKSATVKNGFDKFSLQTLADEVGIELAELKTWFPDKKAIAGTIWEKFMADTLEMAQSDEIYEEYISRQKLLAFYFSFFEVAKEDRDFVRIMLDSREFYEFTPSWMEPGKDFFLKHVKNLVEEGVAIEEVESRMTLSNYYVEPHWYQFLFLLSFWAGDVSKEFEKTDEAIERAVNLGFDLMGRNVLDSAWEFGKFWWNNR